MNQVADEAVKTAYNYSPQFNVHALAKTGLLQLIASTGGSNANNFFASLTIGSGKNRQQFRRTDDETLFDDLQGHLREPYHRVNSPNLPLSFIDLPQWGSMQEILDFRNAPQKNKRSISTIWSSLRRVVEPTDRPPQRLVL